ncbi:hypothetical protein NPIL_607431 [Nephila pilipes]|uniref:Uncharacterized protein n=1 Tax=Nephila pilipes TaxID=299642 RepID=A0A8X6QKB5_NEPPI|nr:hypothetical protein NPIL_607431 [Nephila pilipes]
MGGLWLLLTMFRMLMFDVGWAVVSLPVTLGQLVCVFGNIFWVSAPMLFGFPFLVLRFSSCPFDLISFLLFFSEINANSNRDDRSSQHKVVFLQICLVR